MGESNGMKDYDEEDSDFTIVFTIKHGEERLIDMYEDMFVTLVETDKDINRRVRKLNGSQNNICLKVGNEEFNMAALSAGPGTMNSKKLRVFIPKCEGVTFKLFGEDPGMTVRVTLKRTRLNCRKELFEY